MKIRKEKSVVCNLGSVGNNVQIGNNNFVLFSLFFVFLLQTLKHFASFRHI